MVLSRKNRKGKLFLLKRLTLFPALVLLFGGCSVNYSFSGASIAPEIKTFSVAYFQNRAPLVQVGLSQTLTDALIDKCKAQTNLNYVTGTGDVSFEGDITDYKT
ncbi:MAG TPA: LPS assembly lipoprotein LptE, partial [Bacteroidales bacterium]|nr:LPS assembly lipoprotein LptE [Bacteroidales bacterium]